ncbi:MAG: hypothetical protein JOZ99_02720 [Actinobacteria bacterium]|nr:hypothetical protein [Actinomycetota bacterium]
MKTFIRFLRVIALLAAALGVWRMFVSRPSAGEPDIQPWNPMPAPRPAPRLSVVPEPVIDLTIEEARWAEPVDGDVVPGYPVKGKVGSGIYHVPGGLSYARTIPDRCYATPQDAEADGLRPAKR